MRVLFPQYGCFSFCFSSIPILFDGNNPITPRNRRIIVQPGLKRVIMIIQFQPPPPCTICRAATANILLHYILKSFCLLEEKKNPVSCSFPKIMDISLHCLCIQIPPTFHPHPFSFPAHKKLLLPSVVTSYRSTTSHVLTPDLSCQMMLFRISEVFPCFILSGLWWFTSFLKLS